MKNHIFAGCLVGVALGDALGFSLLQNSSDLILSNVSQLALFTTEGLLWGDLRKKRFGKASYASSCFFSYQRWLSTQGRKVADSSYSWVLDDKRLEVRSPLRLAEEMNHVRGNDSSMADVLASICNQDYGTIQAPINNIKDDSILAAAAPVGLYFKDNPKMAFKVACEIAAITHGHPNAYLSSGLYAAMIACIATGKEFSDAVYHGISLVGGCYGSNEVTAAILSALKQGKQQEEFRIDLDPDCAAYTLSYSIYSAVQFESDYEEAVVHAIQGMNKREMGAVCGGLMGTKLGLEGIPVDALSYLEGKDLILNMTKRLELCLES